MKTIKIALVFALTVLFAVTANSEVINKKYTEKEIKKMADTKAVIETK